MKLRRFTDAGVAKTRAFLAAVKEANNVDNVTLDGAPFTRATLLSSPAYSDAIPRARQGPCRNREPVEGRRRMKKKS